MNEKNNYKDCRVAKLSAQKKMCVIKEDLSECKNLADDEVIIKVEYVGICGSDIHFYAAQKYFGETLPYPIELGHECVGIIVETGRAVKDLHIGDRVALEPGRECECCQYCKVGKYNLCENMDFLASPPDFHGAFREYLKHPAHRCFCLPDNVSLLEGALLEPMAVGFYAAERAKIVTGEKVLVIGAGCIGLMALLGSIAAGASEVFAADVVENRLKKAEELGATGSFCTTKTEVLNGLEADAVIECSGSPKALEMAVRALKSGGRMAVVGCSADAVPVEFAPLCMHEIEIIPIYRYRNMFPKLIEALKTRAVDLRPLISGVYPLEEIQQAFDDAYSNKNTVIKNVVQIWNGA